jgi:hypothetical protein
MNVAATLRGARDRLYRFLGTPAGEVYVAKVTREVAAAETAAERRRRIAEDLATARSRKVDELPALQRAIDGAEREREEARSAVQQASERRLAAHQAADWLAHVLREGTAIAQVRLIATCDPRIRATLAGLEEARRRFFAWTLPFSEPATGALRRLVSAPHPRTRDQVLADIDAAIRKARDLAFLAETPADVEEQLSRVLRCVPPELMSGALDGPGGDQKDGLEGRDRW